MDGSQTASLKDATAGFAASAPSLQGKPALTAAPARVSPRVFLGCVHAVDIVLVLVAGLAAVGVDRPDGAGSLHALTQYDGRCLLAVVLTTIATCWSLRRSANYTMSWLRAGGTQIAALPAPLTIGALTCMVSLILVDVGDADMTRVVLTWVIAAGGLLVASRLLVAWLVARPAMAQRLARRIVVFGANPASQRFIERLHADRATTDRVVAVFDDRRSRVPEFHAGVPVLGRIDDLVAHGRQEPVDAIVVALPVTATARLSEVCGVLRPTVSDIYVAAELSGEQLQPGHMAYIGTNPVLTISRQPLDDWAAFQKRLLDLTVASLLLLLVAPVMLVVALAISIDSDGPILFRQVRRGLNNVDFTVFKFRTMHHRLADRSGRLQAIRNDPRVTRVGRILRQLSFDELPQIFNVLRGDMSLVGPRPHALSTRAGDIPFEQAVSNYAMRHRVKPGITGWAQVNGCRGAIRTPAQLRRRVEFDLYYINNWSIWFDLRIMLMTLNLKRLQSNAY